MPCPADLQTELAQISTTLTDALPISDIQTALQSAATGIAAAVTTGQTMVNQVVSKGIQVGRLESLCTLKYQPRRALHTSSVPCPAVHMTSLLTCCHASLPLWLRSSG